MALKRQIEGRKQVIILTLISSVISFIGLFIGSLSKTMNTEEKKAEYIAGVISDSVDEQAAESMFNLITGIFNYVFIISLVILVLGTITLFLTIWYLNQKNKRKIGVVIYIFSIIHLFSFRIIGSILLYRQALKFLIIEKSKK